MATYKVIQDIEAEDHILGPLSLRQFIYAGAAILCGYFCFLAVAKHIYPLIIFLPVCLLCAFFAFPWGREQPTEVWALAKVRFSLIPRRRIWNQTGIKEMVTITAPKKPQVNYTNGLSQTEVKSRLQALADTIDSRGWAIKNVSADMLSQQATDQASDRLVSASILPQAVDDSTVDAADDMLDEQNSPVAQQFDQMISTSAKTRHAQLLAQMNNPQPDPQIAPSDDSSQASDQTPPSSNSTNPPANYWFLNDSSPASAQQGAQVVVPGTPEDEVTAAAAAQPTAEEEALAEKLHAENPLPTAAYGHLKTVQPLSVQRRLQKQQQQAQLQQQTQLATTKQDDKTTDKPVTQQPDPAIIALANNNDLNVATLARQAKQSQADEVVISLH